MEYGMEEGTQKHTHTERRPRFRCAFLHDQEGKVHTTNTNQIWRQSKMRTNEHTVNQSIWFDSVWNLRRQNWTRKLKMNRVFEGAKPKSETLGSHGYGRLKLDQIAFKDSCEMKQSSELEYRINFGRHRGIDMSDHDQLKKCKECRRIGDALIKWAI